MTMGMARYLILIFGAYLLDASTAQYSMLKFEKVLRSASHAKHLKAGSEYKISDQDGYGRTLDGIGGLSGGGATSRLLVNYQTKYRDQILDYLFKPNFGASLHILKVEIGGDSQSTDGTEASHMHTENETPDFTRGYEWWLMKEAKKRNPNILLAGLAWAWPGWVGGDTSWPYRNYTKTSDYIISWIIGMKSKHGLVIDYVGIWNERPYDSGYIKFLRKSLDSNGLTQVRIVAADGNWSIVEKMSTDLELQNAVDVIGAHYPGTLSNPQAVKTGKILWASEDYSTFNDNIGAGCWARILNQNYVNGNMTATIAWNLIASYYDTLPFKRCSLMTANEPWSGHYEVPDVAWITAHTTQFCQPGWKYLTNSGHLEKGGSYVALTDRKGTELTVVVEAVSHDNSRCIRPYLPPYTVQTQNVTFVFDGSFKSIKKLYMWTTYLGKSSAVRQVFEKTAVDVVDGRAQILLEPDRVVTLTTLSTGMKGSFEPSPASTTFPLPYMEDFSNKGGFSQAPNFADQSGVFEIYENQSSVDGHQSTLRQVVQQRPITWCDDSDSPITIIGNYLWSEINVTVDIKLEKAAGAFVALRVDSGGCSVRGAKGLFLWLYANQSWELTTTLGRNKYEIRCYSTWACWMGIRMSETGWNTLSLAVDNTAVYGYLNFALLFKKPLSTLHDIPESGWAALGVESFSHAQFDNFSIHKNM